jgi:hypothetical protein
MERKRVDAIEYICSCGNKCLKKINSKDSPLQSNTYVLETRICQFDGQVMRANFLQEKEEDITTDDMLKKYKMVCMECPLMIKQMEEMGK